MSQVIRNHRCHRYSKDKANLIRDHLLFKTNLIQGFTVPIYTSQKFKSFMGSSGIQEQQIWSQYLLYFPTPLSEVIFLERFNCTQSPFTNRFHPPREGIPIELIRFHIPSLLTGPALNIAVNNELDITIHVIASQFSGYCDVINHRLWRHQQNVNLGSEARCRCAKIVVFIVTLIVVMSCKKWNNVCTLVPNCFCAHSSVILVFISLVASQLGK